RAPGTAGPQFSQSPAPGSKVDALVPRPGRVDPLAFRVRLDRLEPVLDAFDAGAVPDLAMLGIELQQRDFGIVLASRKPDFPRVLPQPIEQRAVADDADRAAQRRKSLRALKRQRRARVG